MDNYVFKCIINTNGFVLIENVMFNFLKFWFAFS